MVEWEDFWLLKRDLDNVIIGLWAAKKMPIMLDILFAVVI